MVSFCFIHSVLSILYGVSRNIRQPWLVWLSWLENHPVKPKGHGFNSQSGHTPGLQVRSLVGACERGNQLMFLTSIFLSFCLSLPSPFSKILWWGFKNNR